ncbi:MAG: hypothetical protein LBQ42_06025 [Synergistaceae bacterium]|jgi:hypothetical protein|nr:hypothetical protein [Synergistaceae bacterium]
MFGYKERFGYKKKFERRGGFSSLETVCAAIILILAISGTFSAIAYSLMAASESRGRLHTCSKIGNAGLSYVASKNTTTEPDILSEARTVTSNASIGSAALEIKMDVVALRNAAGPPQGKKQKPVFVVFLKR